MPDSVQIAVTLQQLLKDLQSHDLDKYNAARDAIFPIIDDLLEPQQITILQALNTPFPMEDDHYPLRLDLLNHLRQVPEGAVIQVAEKLFHEFDDVSIKCRVLTILSHRSTDPAMQAFLWLAPTVAPVPHMQGPFFHINDGFFRYLPQIISAALSSPSVLAMLCDSSYNWEIWNRDEVRRYGLDVLIPDMLQLFRERIDAISGIPQEGEFYLLYDNVVTLIEILGRPGMPVETNPCFEQLLHHEEVTFSVLAACALIAHDIDLPDDLITRFLANVDTGETFLTHMMQYHQMGKITHLLTQEIIANIFINRCLWARDEQAASIALVSRVSVRDNGGDPVILYLSRVTPPEGPDFHVLTGPYAIDDEELNIDPDLFAFIRSVAVINNEFLLQEAGKKAYADYTEGEQETTLHAELLRQVPWWV